MKLQKLTITVAACLLTAGIGRSQFVEDSVLAPGNCVASLVYNPLADVIYGTSSLAAGHLFAIDVQSNQVVAQIGLYVPYSVVYDSIDNKAYCTFGRSGDESLLVVNGSTHTRVKAVSMPGATTPVWDSVSNRLYVSCQTTNKVAVVDCATDSLLKYIPVGGCPIKMHINTLRRKLYVQNLDAGTVSVIDMATNNVIRTVPVGGNPNAGYYCRSVDKYYCSAPASHVTAVDGRTDSVVGRIPIGQGSQAHSLAGNEQVPVVMAGVSQMNSDYVYALDPRADTVLSMVEVGGEVWSMLYSAETDRLYAAAAGAAGSVQVLSGDGAQLLKSLSVGSGPYVLTAASHRRIYVGHLNVSRVFVVRDTVTGFVCEAPDPPQPGDGLIALPNPFCDDVAIDGQAASRVRVYSLAGKLVRTLARSPGQRFARSIRWDGKDLAGRPVPAGIYFVQAGDGHRTKLVKAR